MKSVPISEFTTQFYEHEGDIPLVVTKRGNPEYYVMKYDKEIVEAIEAVKGGKE